MFHSRVIGAKSSNLDLFFCNEDLVKGLLYERSKMSQIAVIEGVMGYYDGSTVKGMEGSSYHIASVTKTPVILIFNCKGMANSILAMVKGFLTFEAKNQVVGIILNQISESIFLVIKEEIEKEFGNKVTVLGGIPKLPKECQFESRHLGLITADEIKGLQDKLNLLSSIIETHIDMEQLIHIAKQAEQIAIPNNWLGITEPTLSVDIAVAYDNAFCFYYEENLSLLESLGAKLHYFSPITDKKLPDGMNGLILGGGYPELYKKELSANQEMRKSIKSALKQGLPCIAECGGFMYLNQEIEGEEMVGYLGGSCRNQNRSVRFGYITLKAKKDQLLMKALEEIRGHEFHYYDCTENGADFTVTKKNGTSWEAGISNENLYAGYMHMHFYSNLGAAKNFVSRCALYKEFVGTSFR